MDICPPVAILPRQKSTYTRVRKSGTTSLIGRLANTDVELLEREQQYQAGVRIVTYDEILLRQQTQSKRHLKAVWRVS
jgi:hypothetical protein